VEGAGEDAGGDDEQEGGEPGGVLATGSGHEVMVAGEAASGGDGGGDCDKISGLP
jgi:hypothetical protein